MKILIWLSIFLCGCSLYSTAQTGSIHEPVRYIGGVSIDPNVHDGRLPYAIGVESRQTIRVNRSVTVPNDNLTWTYNHASNIAFWNDHFYQQYLSNPVDEHIPPGRTLLNISKNGRHWEDPIVIFPPYKAPPGVEMPDSAIGYMMHQRMGFYVTPDDRLLLLAFYGHAEDPFTTGGIGRVVREIYRDHSLGPIYFIRYDSHTHWNEENTSFPFYKDSPDPGFVKSCETLLADKLMTLQWWDEDHGLDGFYQVREAGEALSYYHRKDGNVVALWKRSKAALSFDGGITFSNPAPLPSLTMAGGKVWGQKTEDGRYALSYNPIELDEYRYPLIIETGDDGIIFDTMLIVQGEVPPRRFYGRWKDFGPCYVRGIVEGNGNPPGEDMWLSYSMNKEDIWVSRIPVPVRSRVIGDLDEDFENHTPGGGAGDWNIYAPIWAPVEIVHKEGNNTLMLLDKDPYDYARAIRVFEQSEYVNLSIDIKPESAENGRLEIDVTDQFGNRPIRIWFDDQSKINVLDGHASKVVGTYEVGKWYNLELSINASVDGYFDLKVNDVEVISEAALAEAVTSVERISIRTGEYRDSPRRDTPNQIEAPPLPGADIPITPAIYHLDNFKTRKVED